MTTVRPEILRRRPDLDFSRDPAEGWLARRRGTETLMNAISFLFPDGERFFVESVMQYRDRIADAALLDQMARFAYQEAAHSRMHELCNEALAPVFAEGAAIGEVCRLGCRISRSLPGPVQLAITCAYEHYTALLADDLLRDLDRVLADARPAYARLWIWHAVEETEHKGVCFDVYRHVVGSGAAAYLLRTLTMAVITACAVGAAALGTLKMSLRRRLTRAGEPRQNPLVLLWGALPLRLYFDYFRPSFHPWDHDNSALVERGRAALERLERAAGA